MIIPPGTLLHWVFHDGTEIGKDDGRLDVISAWIRKNADLFNGKRILDLGSNSGQFPFVYEQMGASYVVAVEPREQHADVFYYMRGKLNSNVSFRWCDLRNLHPYDIIDFEVLSTIGIIYHLKDPWNVLARFLDSSKPAVWIVESMLFEHPGKILEGGPEDDPSTAYTQELVERPTAEYIEMEMRNLGYEPERIDLGPTYKSNDGTPRGFWVGRRK